MNNKRFQRISAFLRRPLYESVTKSEQGRHAPQMPRFLPLLIVVFGVAIVSAWLLFVGFARLIGFDVSPWRPTLGSLPPEQLFDVTRAAATAAGVLAGVFAIVYAYRRQRVEEAGGHREDSEQLSQRYQDAAEQLGHARAAVRLAGVYAMSRLADDWLDQRQKCVDVLCAYLRLPPGRLDVVGAVEEEEVIRRAVLSEIDLHTKSGRADGKSWSDLRIDFSNADLKDVSFSHNTFDLLVMEQARVNGKIDFFSCIITKLIDMSGLQVHGSVLLGLSGNGRVSLWRSEIHSGGALYIHGNRADGVRYALDYSRVAAGGELSVTVSDASRDKDYSLRSVKVAGRLTVFGKGISCEPGTIRVSNLETIDAGQVGFQTEIIDAKALVRPPLAPSATLKLARVEVGEWEVVEDD